MSNGVSESQFYMWRTLFAITHADNILDDGEIEFMAKVLEDIDFSEQQTAILKDDIQTPKDIEEMFKGITELEDRFQFFSFARELVWADGDFGQEEQSAMIKLKRAHFLETDVDELVGKVKLQLEEETEEYERPEGLSMTKSRKNNMREAVFSFRRRFLETITGRHQKSR